ncbi:hypothetical protein, partial [Roseomonas sp. 18066]|uniref:hypothetical protein n=1 Tax=Roseomonas sp. 18066 TaxID=2681412 RepID=UPI001F39BC07
ASRASHPSISYPPLVKATNQKTRAETTSAQSLKRIKPNQPLSTSRKPDAILNQQWLSVIRLTDPLRNISAGRRI